MGFWISLQLSAIMFWHDGFPPERPVYVPKRRRRLSRLAFQHCQLLKSWLKKWASHTLSMLQAKKISVSETSLQLSLKLQGAILSFRNARRLHIRKALAFKHSICRTSMPRVRFKKAQYVFPLLCLSSILVSSSTPGAPSHDGIQVKASFDTDSLDFGVDNRCSACISNVKEHFVGDLLPTNKVIKGYGGIRVHNVYQGTLKLCLEDDSGQVETFLIPRSYYAPDGDARLLSPQHWASTMKNSQRPPKGIAPEQTFHNRVVLTWNRGNSVKTIPMDHLNVATFHLASGYERFNLYCKEAKVDTDLEDTSPSVFIHSAALIEDEPEDEQVEPEFQVASPKATSFNLDGPPTNSPHTPAVIEDEEDRQTNNVTAEFLKYHQKFNHCSPRRMQLLARSGVIPRKLARCPVPVCSSCLYGKATRRPWRTKPSDSPSDGRVPTRPGEVVSVDQLEANVAGLIAQMAGRPTHSRYKVVTVFVDHATGYSYVHFQKGHSAQETVEGKELFERLAASMGHQIRHYHADNGVFASALWRTHCIAKKQGLTFAGVGSHHQNGLAENKIRLLQSQARTMLIHAAKRWPQAVTANLWPYAIRMANDSSNELPSLQFKDGRTPLQAFAGSQATTNPRFWQPFACPVYVLDSALQNAGAIYGKWKERSRVGLYLGRSPVHARSVALVLNLQTGTVSPQFHVTFDPFFQTVKKTYDGLPLVINWQQACGFRAPANRLLPQREPSHLGQPSSATARDMSKDLNPPLDFNPPPVDLPGNLAPIQEEVNLSNLPPPEGGPGWFDVEESQPPPSEGAAWFDVEEPVPPSEGAAQSHTSHTSPDDAPQDEPPQPKRPRGRPRIHPPKPPPREGTRKSARIRDAVAFTVTMICATQAHSPPKWESPNELFCMSSLCPDTSIPSIDNLDLLAYAVSNDPDTLTYHEAMKAQDRDKFIESMATELEGQLAMGVLEPMRRSKVPPTASVLPAVWAFRRKRKQTTGEVYKWKGRLNIGGHRQRPGHDFDLTYSPTASWPAVRLALSMVLLHGWHCKQVDYVQAYPQAPAPRPMFMEIPKGCTIPGYDSKEWVMNVKRNIYGGKDSGRVWYLYLRSKLESIGFKCSKHDDCVFFKGRAMYVLYTDDSILMGPDKAELDQILHEIKHTAKLDITSEDGIEDFLGVTIDRRPDGSIIMSQKRLIQSILEDLNLDDDNVKTFSTPMASHKLLSRHPASPAFDGSFNYRRVIGKLLFLEKSTRPDLSYAVHQCARFSHDPKVEHGQAVKRIGRYLKGTADKGITLKPDDRHSLDLHVDADFAGNWDKEIAADDPATAQSRHGYVLRYCGIPIVWASQLQSLIALSTTEAEYIGMSRALQDTLPVVWLLEEMKEHGHIVHATKADVHCRVFQDNSGALEIANNPKYRPRTKHINQRFHFFRSHIGKHLTVLPIDTEDQVADTFTKPLPEGLFIKHRQTLLGW